MMRQISANVQNVMRRFLRSWLTKQQTEVSNKEQLLICIRWVDDCFVIHENFIGMHPLERTYADQLVAIL